jgi:simple sugar transport system permease protein/ribose transport system permease protein
VAAIMAVAAVIVFTLATDGVWLSQQNIAEVLRVTAVLGVIAAGQAIVISVGEIDVSVGSTFGIVGITYLGLIPILGLVPALLLALILAAGIGLINGWVVTRFAIPSLIVTLGMLFVLRGVAYTAANPPKAVTREVRAEPLFQALGGGELGDYSVALLWALAVGLVLQYMLFWTPLGNRLLAVGGNRQSARSRGVHVSRVKVTAFVTCSLLAGLAGVIEASNLGYADGAFGRQRELPAIAAAVLGGCALAGGRSSIVGTFLGAFILSAIASFLVIQHMPPQWYLLLLGLIIIVVSLADRSLLVLSQRLLSQRAARSA